ncbi:hypothetical protein F5Y19DRAFT_472399 [Xylariaceae sp. FL1651]|nr:hypothetical protein F5Y19DRAFT_472399 [Xylariaceae sp. FL1651]
MPSPSSSPPSPSLRSPPKPTATIVRSTKGLFRNGAWHCNCSPRLKAVQKTAKRKTKNQGRTFYCCPVDKNEGNRCDFFLWTEDAHERARNSLLSNNRSEMTSPPQKPKKQMTLHESLTPRQDKRKLEERTPLTKLSELQSVVNGASTSTSSLAPAPALESSSKSSATAQGSTIRGRREIALSWPDEDIYGTSSDEAEVDSPTRSRSTRNGGLQPSMMPKTTITRAAGSKRKQPTGEDDNYDISSGAEEELAAIAEKSSETSRTLGRYRDAFITPNSQHVTDMKDGLPTPSLTREPAEQVCRRLFTETRESSSNSAKNTSNAKRQRVEDQSAATQSNAPTRAQSSTTVVTSTTAPSSTPHGLNTPSTSSAGLTQEVMDLLKDEKISESVRNAVRRTLNQHAAQAKGLERGRDIARNATKKAEARIAQLQAKVADLETARVNCRSKLLNCYQES